MRGAAARRRVWRRWWWRSIIVGVFVGAVRWCDGVVNWRISKALLMYCHCWPSWWCWRHCIVVVCTNTCWCILLATTVAVCAFVKRLLLARCRRSSAARLDMTCRCYVLPHTWIQGAWQSLEISLLTSSLNFYNCLCICIVYRCLARATIQKSFH